MNIIYDIDKNNLRLISFNPNETYQLNELKFYIPKRIKITPFLLIKNSKGEKEILKLTQRGSDQSYNVFGVSVEQTIAADAGDCSIALINVEDDFIFSNPQKISLDFDDYKIGNQLYLIEELSKNVILTYKQIEELTKMNIEIYQSIKGGDF